MRQIPCAVFPFLFLLCVHDRFSVPRKLLPVGSRVLGVAVAHVMKGLKSLWFGGGGGQRQAIKHECVRNFYSMTSSSSGISGVAVGPRSSVQAAVILLWLRHQTSLFHYPCFFSLGGNRSPCNIFLSSHQRIMHFFWHACPGGPIDGRRNFRCLISSSSPPSASASALHWFVQMVAQ